MTFSRRSDVVGARARRGSFSAALAGIAIAGLFAASPALANPSPIITDYAGNGTAAPPTPGPATSSSVRVVEGLAVDSAGNLYIADTKNFYVEKVTPDGNLTIIAGQGSPGAPTPGPASNSALGFPAGIAVDGTGNIYIADTTNHLVEKIAPDNTLSIIAGDGTNGPPLPGPATSSALGFIQGVAVDTSGNLYIADPANQVIEKLSAGGTLSVFAGDGTPGPPTQGPATSSELDAPRGVGTDSAGDVFIADSNNHLVERVTPAGTLSIVAGNGSYGAPTAGPATSSALADPQGVAVDGAGNLYIADPFNQVVEAVAPNGTLSIFAGTGTSGVPTYGGPATASDLNFPFAVAVAPGGAAFISDLGNFTIDRVGFATPGPPGPPMLSPGDDSAQLSFTPPTDPGTSAITGYQISFDGGATWQSITTSAGGGGTLTATLTGLSNGTAYTVIVRAVNSSGPGADSPSGSVTPGPAAPTNVIPPSISGIARVGGTLACSKGSWTGNPTQFGYQWDREGLPVVGASARTYSPRSGDQGHSLTCTVTASNSAGSAHATSPGVLVAIANVRLCPKPTGRLAGTRLGPVRLGLSRSRARRMLPRFQIRSSHTDNFCLAGGWGIRAGYATAQLRGKLPGDPHASGMILLLTANPYYSLHGVAPGMRVTAADRLTLGKVIHLGRNWWYVIPGPDANWVLKTRHGVIQEIGIARKQLTATGLDQVRLLAHF